MRVCGIIAEYNPLHNGHVYHLQRARALSGCDRLIVAMSGSCVQRGEIACYDKFVRAKWAIEAGADMVIELPADFALRSAQGFAEGGVRLLAAAGANCLCFGSEAGKSTLFAACDALDHPDFSTALKAGLGEGLPYHLARHKALLGIDRIAAKALAQPNAILAAEYIIASRRFAPMELFAVKRVGGGYNDGALAGSMSGAAAIRNSLDDGEILPLESTLPAEVYAYVQSNKHARMDGLQNAALYALRGMSTAQLADIYGIGEGLEYLFAKGAREGSLGALLIAAKSKRYPMARIKRALCCALLGITKQHAALAGELGPRYIRVLGFKKIASHLFSDMSLPIVSQKAHMNRLNGFARAMCEHDLQASDLQALAFDDECRRRAGRDYTEKVFVST